MLAAIAIIIVLFRCILIFIAAECAMMDKMMDTIMDVSCSVQVLKFHVHVQRK